MSPKQRSVLKFNYSTTLELPQRALMPEFIPSSSHVALVGYLGAQSLATANKYNLVHVSQVQSVTSIDYILDR